MRLPLGVTVGDPAGIGPEIVLRLLANGLPAPVIVYGSSRALDACARRLSLPSCGERGITVHDTGGPEVPRGRPSADGGHAAAEAVLAAARDALAGRLAGLVTAPLNKESLKLAGYPWPGHTEMLAEAAGGAEVAMMFVGGGLRVALLTIHRSLRSVPDAIDGPLVESIVRLVDRELPRLGATRRRIALCGLNPHAGENGLFGHEEEEVLKPAVARLQRAGLDVHGPFPADTLFTRASRGEFDAVIAGYHDQGLIPVKLAAFGHAVNVTLGLPFVRTSVDHGTGFDIVEAGTADETSLRAAFDLAAQLTA